jgi:hypothetical protein
MEAEVRPITYQSKMKTACGTVQGQKLNSSLSATATEIDVVSQSALAVRGAQCVSRVK